MEWVKDERVKHEITQVKERKQHTTERNTFLFALSFVPFPLFRAFITIKRNTNK